jgi:heat shock protein beta
VWSSRADGGFTVAEDDPAARAGPAAAADTASDFGRGTWLRLHLKDDARDYASETKLRELVGRYSEFINYPIYLETEKEVEVPLEEESSSSSSGEIGEDASKTEVDAKKKKSSSDDEGVEDEEDAEDDAKIAAAKGEDENPDKPKTRKEKRREWAVVNEQKPLWLRPASEVSEDEYAQFYKSLSRDWQPPLAHVHFKAEGDLDFRALAFLPKTAPYDFYEKYHEPSSSARPSVKLYSRRVLVADDLGDSLVPKYLSWARGVVDSDALPLSVSRETLQASGSLRTVKKKLGRKILDAVKRLADEQAQCLADEQEKKKSEDGSKKKEDEKEKDGDKKDALPEACSRYSAFYDAFGRALKMGVIEDASNRGRLAKLLRFRSSLFPGDDDGAEGANKGPSVSLDDYAKRARERAEQQGLAPPKNILFVTAPSLKEARASPFAESAVSKGHEVLYFTDVLDEYVTQHLTEHDDLQLADLARDGTVDWARLSGQKKKGDDKSGDDKENASSSTSDDADAVKRHKEADKAARKRLRPLTRWWKAVLGPDTVGGVRVSLRLPPSTPAAVAAGRHGPSAQMERIMRAQAMGGAASAHAQAQAAAARQARYLEVNADHPLVAKLAALVGEWDGGDNATPEEAAAAVPAEARATALLLYDAALLEGGYLLDDARATTRRVYAMLQGGGGDAVAGGKSGKGESAAAAKDEEDKEEDDKKDEGVEDEHDEL